MKPSALAILEFLHVDRKGDWTTADQIIRNCYTTCPHKRLSELIDLGYVQKTDKIDSKGRKYYRSTVGVR